MILSILIPQWLNKMKSKVLKEQISRDYSSSSQKSSQISKKVA